MNRKEFNKQLRSKQMLEKLAYYLDLPFEEFATIKTNLDRGDDKTRAQLSLEDSLIINYLADVYQGREGSNLIDRIIGKPQQFVDMTTNGKDLPVPILSNLSDVHTNNSTKKTFEIKQEN